MTDFVCGFVFSRGHVLLIKKNRPDWQAGRINGIGGKIQVGKEFPLQAMVREFHEETGVHIPAGAWRHFATFKVTGLNNVVYFYTAKVDGIEPKQMTDEEPGWYPTELPAGCPFIENLHWLVPMAMDDKAAFANVEYAR